jgi:4-amino-4-deoxy-L-arabinose transferase-like glycosyltransferase
MVKNACLYILLAAVLVILAVSVLSNTVTKELGRDEHMYCTAGYLTAQGKLIYRDFSYVAQMPYHPLFCAGLYKLLNTDWYLLTARFLPAFCELIILVCIIGIYKKVFGSSAVAGTLSGIWAAFFYILNEYVDYSVGYAWNHSAVIACVLIALWLSLGVDYKKSSRVRLFMIGALLTIAVFTRPTAGLAFIAFIIMLLIIAEGGFWSKIKFLVPFAAGSVFFSIWPLSVIIRSGQAFRLNIFTIPKLNAQFLYEAEMVYDKTGLSLAAVLSPGYMILIVLFIILAVYCLREHIILEKKEKIKLILSIVLAAVFIISAYIPPTMWPQYLAVPAPFILICFAVPLAGLRGYSTESYKSFRKFSFVMLAGLIILLWYSPQRFFVRTTALFDTGKWNPVRVHKISKDIFANAPKDKLAMTLSPLYAIEGGCEIYTELSAGSFVYRVADRLTKKQLQITNTVGPETIEKLIRNRTPALVICNEQMRFLDESIIKQAVKEGWSGKIYGENGPTVFFSNSD